MKFVLPQGPTKNPCLIDEGDTAILTGGTRSGYYQRSDVQRFDSSGLVETLPSLNLARGTHGCGKYQNSNGETVMMIIDVSYWITEIRCTWWPEAGSQEE